VLLTRALKLPEVRDAFAKQGMETLPSTPEQAANHIERERTVWKKVIADAGLRLE
jgi:tripartite-type tricarboxylate transporter receptor subunit TctC